MYIGPYRIFGICWRREINHCAHWPLKEILAGKNGTRSEDESYHSDHGEDDIMLDNLFEEKADDDYDRDDDIEDVGEESHVLDGSDCEPQLQRGQRNHHTSTHSLTMFYIPIMIKIIETL